MKRMDNRGIALVLTLMVVAIITAMVVEFAYGVYVSTNALHNWKTSQQLSLAARSATELGARLVAEKYAGKAAVLGPLEISQKIPFDELEGTITVRIEDENARFNIRNIGVTAIIQDRAAYDAFGRLLEALNLNPEIADRLVDWVDADSIPNRSDIADVEMSAKNAPLDSIDELLSIPGIDQETFDRLKPYVTIYGSNQINLNNAEVPVLMSLHENIDKGMAENITRYRQITPFQSPMDLQKVGGVPQNLSTALAGSAIASNTFRIVATATSGDMKRIIESVMDISGSTRTVRYWREY
ncbi:MAG: type II secretion system minor pseudopilin GspK [Nitrospiraceae bacterium]|nr:type II secretion system minor pseudopilin GspK [Nitrospiraceae bacterium]